MVQFDKRLARNIDLSVLLIALVIAGIGLITIASATHYNIPGSYSMEFLKVQFAAVVLGLLLIAGILLVDYRWLKDYSLLIYLFTTGILGVTLVMARTVSGAKAWFHIGPVSLQPSEICKLLVIIVLASYIADHQEEMRYLTGMFKAGALAGFPALMVLAQNDLGTALVFIGITIGMLFVGGGNAKAIFIPLFLCVVLVMGLVIVSMHHPFDFPFLKSYQLKRLQVLVDPYIDPFGHGYNLIQSEIAIGSGQLLGKGLFKGTQNQLRFLPEKHTDFIYSVVGEEFGFVGSVIVLTLYLALLLKSMNIAREARDTFGTLIVVGIVSMWTFHILENVGMVIGIMPVTGIPLPFVSYGGTSMMTNMIAVGLILNVRMRKQKIMF